MEIKQFVWSDIDSNSWLIVEGNNGLLVDAIDSKALYEAIRELDELTVIITHSHFDHICGLNSIRILRPDVKVISTRLCSEYIGNKYRNMSSVAAAYMAFYNGRNDYHIDPIVCERADIVFDEELCFAWWGHTVCLKAYHGHSEDSLVAVLDGDFMFSGDTILSIPTVTRLPGGSKKRFVEEDIPNLTVQGAKQVFPGHGKQGSLEDMLKKYIKPE